jgi:3-hydroxyacyl-CoA dehydrogenase
MILPGFAPFHWTSPRPGSTVRPSKRRPLLRRMVAAGLLGRKTGRGFFSYEGNAMFGA